MPRVVCVTCDPLPEPDPDEPLLRRAVEAAGGEYLLRPWDGAPFDWASADLVVPRSTWNYYERPDAFLAWVEHVDARARLCNPAAVVRRTLHKRYLLELAAVGIDVVPTELISRGERRTLASVRRARGWDDVVIKPAIGARSWNNLRVTPDALADGEAHLARLLAQRDVLVQPYVRSVEDHGERSLIWIDGALTHSIRKEPRFGDDDESVSDAALPPPPGADDLLRDVLGWVDEDLLYARVDVVPDADGRPMVMELELVEPSLYLAQDAAALDRFAAALVRRAAT